MQERLPDAPGQFGNRVGDAAEELDVAQQEVVDHGDPDLSQDGIAGSAEEGFDFEVLLDPFKEDLDLPALAIDLSDGEGTEVEVVGEETVEATRIGVSEGDETKRMGVFLVGDRSFELNAFIGENGGRGGWQMLSGNSEALVVEGSGDEVGADLVELLKPAQSEVGAVKAVDAVRSQDQVLTGDAQIMSFSVADDNHRGQMAAVIQEAMEFDGAFLATEVGPIEDTQAEIDGSGIKRVQGMFETEAMGGSQALSSSEDGPEQGFEDGGGTSLHGIGQCGAGDGSQSQVIQACRVGHESTLNRSQRVLAADLGVEQNQELLPGRKRLGIAVGLELAHHPGKSMSGDELKKLMEDGILMTHGLKPPSELGLHLQLLQEVSQAVHQNLSFPGQ